MILITLWLASGILAALWNLKTTQGASGNLPALVYFPFVAAFGPLSLLVMIAKEIE